MICSAYEVKLHIIENLPHAGWSDQLVDGLASRSIDYVDYSEENTIHVINKGGGHFEPILRKKVQQMLLSSNLTQIQKSTSQFYDAKSYESQESSTRSSSASSDSVWYSVSNDTANGVSLTDNEITKKATLFVKNSRKNFLNFLKRQNQVQKYEKQAE